MCWKRLEGTSRSQLTLLLLQASNQLYLGRTVETFRINRVFGKTRGITVPWVLTWIMTNGLPIVIGPVFTLGDDRYDV